MSNSKKEEDISSYCYHNYTVEKEPFSFSERWRVKKDGISIGSIEKEPISMRETWRIKDFTEKTVGSIEKEFVSIGNEYAIKNPYGRRIGKMEETLGSWRIQVNDGEKLEFNENFPLTQWRIEGGRNQVSIEKEPLSSSYRVKSEGLCDRNRSLLEQQLPVMGAIPILDEERENRRKKLYYDEEDDEPIYKRRNYFNSPSNDIQSSWRLPSPEDTMKNLIKIPDPLEDINNKMKNLIKIPDPLEDINKRYNLDSSSMFNPSWNRDRLIGNFDR